MERAEGRIYYRSLSFPFALHLISDHTIYINLIRIYTLKMSLPAVSVLRIYSLPTLIHFKKLNEDDHELEIE